MEEAEVYFGTEPQLSQPGQRWETEHSAVTRVQVQKQNKKITINTE